MHPNYDVVFFDAANTLLYPYPSVGDLYTEVAGQYGVSTTPTTVQQAFRQSWGRMQQLAQHDPRRYGVGEPDGRRFWHALVHETFSQIALPEAFDAFFDTLYHLFAQASAYRTFPETLPVLQTLRQRGLRVGVISNWDSRLSNILDGLGLMAYLEHVTISAVVGWDKPRGEIFQHAIHTLGLSPSRALHIGDNLTEDVQGADQAGLQPLWLQREGTPQTAYPVIRDLYGVLTWLDAHQ